MPTVVRIELDPASLRSLLGKSSKFDAAQKRNIRKRIRAAAEDTRKAVQSAAEAGGPSKKGLRAGIARGTRTQVLAGQRTAGVRIVTRAKLGAAWQGKGWRHPVFGTDTWAAQTGHPGYFTRTIWASRHKTRRAVEQAMQDTLREMGGR